MYKFHRVNLSLSKMVYTYKTADFSDVYSAYCKANLFVVNDKYTFKDFISKVLYDA